MNDENKHEFYFLAKLFFDEDEPGYIYKYGDKIIATTKVRIHTASGISNKYKDGYYEVKNKSIKYIEDKLQIPIELVKKEKAIKYIENDNIIKSIFKKLSNSEQVNEIKILQNRNLTVDKSFIDDILKFGDVWDVTVFEDVNEYPRAVQFEHKNLTAYIMPMKGRFGVTL